MAPTANANDALLEELNGALAKTGEPSLVAGDHAQEQPPALDKQLETTRPAAPAIKHAVNLDKTLSKKAGAHGYRVIVVGEYYARSSETKGNVTKRYSLPFNLPSLVSAKGESALGIIVGQSRPNGGLLKSALQKMDPLAITFRTHSIESVTPLQGAPEPTSLAYMSFEPLKVYVRENIPDFPVDVDEYFDVAHLREDVIDFKTNTVTDVVDQAGNRVKGGFGVKKTPSDRILERHTARKEEKELADMNDGL
jgi:hypothetical protein